MNPFKTYTTNHIETTEIFWIEELEQFYDLQKSNYSQIVTFVDDNCYQAHKKDLNFIENIQLIKDAEKSKSFVEIEKILYQLNEMNIDKKALFVSIGGGAISDIVGFLGSIYMRGVDVGYIPTTLLGMVDAAIGGKTGINLSNIKNAIGTIKQPRFVMLFNPFLDTLSEDEFSNGCAEIIKYAAIMDKKMWEMLFLLDLNMVKNNLEIRTTLINKCIENKIKIISKDSQDVGLRKTLNFGHTLGHAIESLYKMPHGKAVACGMMFAIFVSEKINKSFELIEIDELMLILDKFNLPSKIKFDADEVLERIMKDKKRILDDVQFVVLTQIGKSKLVSLNREQIKQYLTLFQAEYPL